MRGTLASSSTPLHGLHGWLKFVLGLVVGLLVGKVEWAGEASGSWGPGSWAPLPLASGALHPSGLPVPRKKGRGPSIFCWIMTGPANHDSRAAQVKETWGRDCDGLVFVSSVTNASLPSLALGAEGRGALWSKTKGAVRYLHREHGLAYDWFLKADDDTYVVVDNLRSLLAPLDPDKPLYLGSKFKMTVKNGYMSGGAGYAMSRAAVKVMAEVGLSAAANGSLCHPGDDGDEDVLLGLCLQSLNVTAMDTRDGEGRLRFVPDHLGHLLFPKEHKGSRWVNNYASSPVSQGVNCCAPSLVAMHKVSPESMHLIHFFLHTFAKSTL